MAMISLRRGTMTVRVVALTLALVAGAFTLRSGLAFLLATPETANLAIRIDPTNTNALSVDANERLKTVELGAPAAKLAADSKRILEHSPYEVVALRNIGIIAASNDDEKGAAKLLDIAARLSLRDYLTHAWLLDYQFRTNEVAPAVTEADILLRQDDQNWPVILPALIALTRDPRIIDPLARVLATRPYWRSTFLTRLGSDSPHPDATLALLTRLKAIGSPASKEELDPYFIKVADRLSPTQLFAQWVALLPPGARSAGKGPLREGDFAGLDVSPPFGWRLYPADGVYADRTTGPEGMGSALYVSYSGERDTVFANQELVLPAGHYRFAGRVFAEDAIDAGVFRWSILCMTKGATGVLGTAPLNPLPGQLGHYAIEFDVPAKCDQQQLALMGAARDATFDTLALYVDGLAIARLR
ncbi:hypothetical protein [Sphingomonas mali]|uniref:hypothetical protein n=1 Tax=Sphingomonas mali TaxID=40682 RepID=UPI000A89B0BE|nr:hypothetical protein [Sphingomonas mali]